MLMFYLLIFVGNLTLFHIFQMISALKKIDNLMWSMTSIFYLFIFFHSSMIMVRLMNLKLFKFNNLCTI